MGMTPEKKRLGDDLDRQLFLPLNQFLQSTPFDPDSVEAFISEAGYLKGRLGQITNYRGLVFEAHVRKSLLEFCAERPFKPIRFRAGVIKKGHKFSTDNFGHVLFANRKDRLVVEVDALFEFYNSDGRITPFVFEFTANRRNKMGQAGHGRRRKLANQIYDQLRPSATKAFSCEIVGYKVDEGQKLPRLHRSEEKLYRMIGIPYTKEFHRLAMELYSRAVPVASVGMSGV